MTLALLLVVVHFVGDFVCQSDWMAINKSKNWGALGVHVLVYSLVLLLLALPVSGDRPDLGWLFVAVNGALHFLTDAVTSRITSRLWFFRMESGIWTQAAFTVPKHGRELVNPWVPGGGNRHWFFVAIGFDQVLHYAALFITADWLLI